MALAKSANGNLSQFESEETNGRFPTPAETLQLALGNGRKGASPCENVRAPRKRRTVFSIAFFG